MLAFCGASLFAAPLPAADISTSLMGWWKFDEGSGSVATDSSGNGNTGTLVGSPAWVAGKLGTALSFNGTSNNVNVGDMNAADGASSLTVAAWVYDARAAASQSVVSKYNSAQNASHFVLQTSDLGKGGGGNDIMFALGNVSGYTTGSVHQANRWEHWVSVFDGSQTGNAARLKLYLNGVQQSLTFSGTIPATTKTSAYPIRIASDSDMAAFFRGRIDDVRIYARPLSTADVAALYAYTGAPPDTTPPTVSITAPSSGSTVSGTNAISISASDDVGIGSIQVTLDGGNLGTAITSPPYQVSWTTTTVSNGSHTLSALATDTAGNQATAADVIVTVSNATPAPGTLGYPRLSDDGTYLIDLNNQPFFITGDAAWSLIAQLNDSDTVTYLSDRASRHFNTIIANLIEHKFASRAPANINGDLPFTGTAFQSPPNEAYFAHADFVIQQAQNNGITLLLFPCYAGYACGDEGWCAELQAATDAQMYAWGQYVGNRYKNYANLIWVIGADVDPTAYSPLQSRLNQVALGIRASDPNHALLTAHDARGQSAMDVWAGYPWLTLNTAYGTNTTIAAVSAANYSRSGALPLLDIEDYYENEHSMTPLDLRKEFYWAVLNGCTLGRVFGNTPIWGFSYLSSDWKNSLGSTGSVQAALAGQLMRSRSFWLMAPDLNHAVMTAGYSSGSTLAVTSRSRDGKTIVSYIPTQRQVTMDLTKISSSSAKAWWYNPQTGASTLIGVFPTTGVQSFRPPKNQDWVLVIDDASLNLPAPG